MIETSGRYDGHYYFAPSKRWAFFPSISVGWNISEEDFIKNKFTNLEMLKLRTSYGESENLAGSPSNIWLVIQYLLILLISEILQQVCMK